MLNYAFSEGSFMMCKPADAPSDAPLFSTGTWVEKDKEKGQEDDYVPFTRELIRDLET